MRMRLRRDNTGILPASCSRREEKLREVRVDQAWGEERGEEEVNDEM